MEKITYMDSMGNEDELDQTTLPAIVKRIIWSAPKGSYQEDLLMGKEAWSGATLEGKARDYSARYSASRENLLNRINADLDQAYNAGETADHWVAATYLISYHDGVQRRYRRELIISSWGGLGAIW
jgi:hypothetical protein